MNKRNNMVKKAFSNMISNPFYAHQLIKITKMDASCLTTKRGSLSIRWEYNDLTNAHRVISVE